jgi:CBS domain-containing protein
MLVRDVMTSPAVTVTETTKVRAAARVLDAHAVTAVPVVDGSGALVGVLSEADLIREMLLPDPRVHVETPPSNHPPRVGRVGEVMTRMPVVVSPAEDLSVAVELMTSTTVKSLPVVEHGRLLGMLSRRDVLRALARADDTIEIEVNALLKADGTDWWATVEDGVVEVAGPQSEPERRVAEVLAGSVTGVVAVRCVDG